MIVALRHKITGRFRLENTESNCYIAPEHLSDVGKEIVKYGLHLSSINDYDNIASAEVLQDVLDVLMKKFPEEFI